MRNETLTRGEKEMATRIVSILQSDLAEYEVYLESMGYPILSVRKADLCGRYYRVIFWVGGAK